MYRDSIKDYKESPKYYMKCLEINKRDYGTNGSYGYLLYLMSEYDKALNHIEIELDLEDNNNWAHFYQALVYNAIDEHELEEIALWKALSQCKTTELKEDLQHLQRVRESNENMKMFIGNFRNMMMNKMDLNPTINCKLI